MQTSSLKQNLLKSIGLRAKMGFGEDDGFRLCDGDGDGLDDVFIDCYAGHWVVGTRNTPFPSGLRSFVGRSFDQGTKQIECRSLWQKRLEVGEKEAPQFVAGERVSADVLIREGELRFIVQLESGYSQGIFLDQRDNRQEVARRAKGARFPILNLFAYTCGFSVAAATGGAEAVSIDLSRNYLDWGRRNFEANGIDPSCHGFIKDDALDVLRRFGKKGRQFSGVVLDPPTFSRNEKGRVFRVETDYADLVYAATCLVESGGWLLCCSNTRKVTQGRFTDMVGEGVSRAKKEGKFSASPMPGDFTGEKYLKAVWVEIR